MKQKPYPVTLNVAVAVCNTAGDSPSVFVVDINRCSQQWQAAIAGAISGNDAPMPEEWESLLDAQLKLPVIIHEAVTVYYDG